MKVRDSGMPEELIWSEFFDPVYILHQMQVTPDLQVVVDLGCGYGTFTMPASEIIKGTVLAYDIEDEMIDQLQTKISQLKITNIQLFLSDFIAEGTGLADNSTDYTMLFNILHHDNPYQILTETYRILKKGAIAGIMHWRSDIPTPRGPETDIRPTPEQCKKWAINSGFSIQNEMILRPFHFGIVIKKP